MTARKDSLVPKGAERNLWFEAAALRELERLPTRAWEDMDALWRMLPSAWPSTRQRILARCLELAEKRGDGLSAKLVNRFAKLAIAELAVRAPKARVHDEDGFRAVARHLASNPQASLSELAAAADAPKGTIRQWRKRPDFQALLNDERRLVALEQARRAWRLEHGSEGFEDLGAAAADWLDQRDVQSQRGDSAQAPSLTPPPRRKVKCAP
jgi:hypothetical protein